jgi:hypothetical protein
VSFIKRLVYYLGGVGLGVILLMFFLSGKKTSCDYGPNARTLKFLKSKPLIKSDVSQRSLAQYNLDSLNIESVFSDGEVNFKDSEISGELPNMYVIEVAFENKGYFKFKFLVKKEQTELISIHSFDP